MKYQNYTEAVMGEDGLAVVGVFLKVSLLGCSSPGQICSLNEVGLE